eukprot:g45242.t1
MSEELNRFFASVFTVEDTSNIPELQESQGPEGNVMAITKEVVLGKLKSLKADKSPRQDGLYPRVLKEIAEEIVETLLENNSRDVLLRLYIRVWSEQLSVVCLRKDMLALEKVQRRFTRMIPGMKGLPYVRWLMML